MLGLEQVQRTMVTRQELRLTEVNGPVSFYPLRIESRGGPYNVTQRSCSQRSSQRCGRGSAAGGPGRKAKSLKLSRNLDFTSIDSTFDQKRYQLIRKRLENCLSLAEKKQLRSSLRLPYNLLNKISQDVLRMSKSEPNGIDGCVIKVELLEREDTIHHVGQITFDGPTPPSTELTLRLRKDLSAKPLAARIQKFVDKMISHKTCIEISPGFQLVKERRSRNSSRTMTDSSNECNDSSFSINSRISRCSSSSN